MPESLAVIVNKVERINITPSSPVAARGGHRHSWNELICPLRGDYLVTLADGRQYRSGPGSVFVYPAGCTHRATWLGAGDIATDFYLVCWQGLLPDPRPPIHGHLPDDLLRHLLGWMLDNHRAGDSEGRRVNALVLQGLLIDLARQHAARDDLVQIVDSLIDQTRDRRLQVADLAAAAGLSRFHFTRRFKGSTGTSPMAYLRERQLGLVCQDLRDSDRPIKEIASRRGFATPQQLATLFRRRFGMTPRQFRQQDN